MSDSLDADDRAKLADGLIKSEAWRLLFLPKLRERMEHHNSQVRSRNLSPAARAEHIEACHLLEELIRFPEEQIEAARKKNKQ